jgi:hypothetical protein
MSKGDGSSGGSNVGVVVLIVALLLAVPCCGGLALFGAGFFFTAVDVSPPPAIHSQKMPAVVVEPQTLSLEPAVTTEPESAPPVTTDTVPATSPAP